MIYQRYVELLGTALPALETTLNRPVILDGVLLRFPVLIRADSAVSRDAIILEYVSIISMPAVISTRLSAPSRCIATSRRRMPQHLGCR